MARVRFGGQLMRQLGANVGAGAAAVDVVEVEAVTVGSALEAAFARVPSVKGYVVDEQGRVRKHVAVFIDGRALADRARLDEAITSASEIYVLQALSGG